MRFDINTIFFLNIKVFTDDIIDTIPGQHHKIRDGARKTE